MAMNGIEAVPSPRAQERLPAQGDEKDPAMLYNVAQVARAVIRPGLRVSAVAPARSAEITLSFGDAGAMPRG
jgi:hypothetical protein